MKILAVISFIFLLSFKVEIKYDKIFDFGEYKNNWAMVKIDNKLGFINAKGNYITQ